MISRRAILRWFEYGWHAAVLLLLLGAFLPMWRKTALESSDALSGDPVSRAMLLGAFGISILYLLLHVKSSVYLVLKSPWPWLLVAWLFLSTSWSDASGISLRRAAAIALATLYAMVLFLRFDTDELLKLLGIALGLAMLASLVVSVLYPSWGVMSGNHAGSWRGVFSHKNFLGRSGAFAVMVFAVLAYRGKNILARLIAAGMLLLSLLVVYGSRSATGYVLVAVVVAAFAVVLIFEKGRRAWPLVALVGAGLAIVVAVVVIPNYAAILNLLGRSASLTGRVPLWLALIAQGRQHALLGYGFGAFWLGWNGPSAQIWSLFTWLPPHAHNGYLDLWLELGFVGLALFVGFLLFLLLRAWNMLVKQAAGAEFWFLFLVFVVVVNVPETTLLESASGKIVYWVLLTYFCFAALVQPRVESRRLRKLAPATSP